MTTHRRITDLQAYRQVLPYASEIFGIYQPLLGWKSQRMVQRQRPDSLQGDEARIAYIAQRLQLPRMAPQGPPTHNAHPASLPDITIARPRQATSGSALLRVLGQALREGVPVEEIASEDSLKRAIETVRQQLRDNAQTAGQEVEQRIQDEQQRLDAEAQTELKTLTDPDQRGLRLARLEEDKAAVRPQVLQDFIERRYHAESLVAGTLSVLHQQGQFPLIQRMVDEAQAQDSLAGMFEVPNPDAWMDTLDPTDLGTLNRVGLSPIGIVHLYRQYFFEFDTFLGPPVNHVWLSPGASVELIETTTRRTLVERSSEYATENTLRHEQSLTDQDELSEAVKTENQQNLKFGASTSVNQGWITGSATGTANLQYDDTQKMARELAHKHMRTQSEKLSAEIKKNYKSSFKVVTESTDTSSKRYVLSNSTDQLINYELRRKMRQVGVQVQDIGSYLCWQTFVDDPGADLGVAQLFHMAKAPDPGQTPPFEPVAKLEPFTTETALGIPYQQTSSDRGDLDESYGGDGYEIDTDANEGKRERINVHFSHTVVCERSRYHLRTVTFDTQGQAVQIELTGIDHRPGGSAVFHYHLLVVNFAGQESMTVKARLHWEPDAEANQIIDQQNTAALALEEQRRQAEEKKAYLEAVKDRITAASKIAPRRFETLREEERIVVYRKLIDELLPACYQSADARTRHKLSELLNAIFDIDKMLYFVAPEYWRPRMHASHQVLGRQGSGAASGPSSAPSPAVASGLGLAQRHATATLSRALRSVVRPSFVLQEPRTAIDREHLTTWGGSQGRRDNYLITEESNPAPMGASLGWLLQLDGDERRNAFLNAPWVKAVIPVRPGKELAAVNWLEHAEGHADGLDFDIEALRTLARTVQDKHQQGNTVGTFPSSAIDEPVESDRVQATPVDRVYEHGFYPLQGGFKTEVGGHFETVSQWVEALPTDQIVPVEVRYDPRTGRQM